MVKRRACPACLFLAKPTTMDYCLHLHAPLVLMRISITCRPKKKCSHQWTNECLNSTGEYIIFPSEMYHHGYYNQKSDKIFIQAQLFCAPTNDTNVLRLPRSLMKAQGQQITRGCLDESTLSELRDDLLNNWEIHYSNPEYQPSKNFSGGPVDRESNRQI